MVEEKGLFIRISENKKELLRKVANANGISMNEFINKAIDISLSIETRETIQLSRDKELLEHELKSLEENKEIYLKNYNEDKELLQQKMQQIDSAIQNIHNENEEKSEIDNYNKLVNLVCNGRRIDNISDLILDHAEKYNVDAHDLRINILKDVEHKKFRG